MADLIPIKKSHIKYYNDFPLYYISKSGEALLYKNAEKKLDKDLLDRNQYPQFFIHKKDKAAVVEKLQGVLNVKFARVISSKGLVAIKKSLCNIVEEALSGPLEKTLSSLPETIEILFYGAKRNPDLLDALTAINNKCSKIVEHSVNVLALTAQYCFFKKFSEDQIKTICLCALLHDIGTSRIDRKIIETREMLTDKEYSIYKTHTVKGQREIQLYPTFDKSVAITALEHHERLDGSGYPSGIKQMSFESQLIGLIDSYEALKYQDKTFRKALKPYDALQIIKTDVVAGKYNKKIFIDLCSCLIK